MFRRTSLFLGQALEVGRNDVTGQYFITGVNPVISSQDCLFPFTYLVTMEALPFDVNSPAVKDYLALNRYAFFVLASQMKSTNDPTDCKSYHPSRSS